jgi:hypothetical protein
VACLLALAWPALAEARDPLFPPEGCSPTSLVNSCRTRAPAPIGDPTDGPLTDTLRDGPLDPPKDPLGLDPIQPKSRGPLLAPAKDRLGIGNGQ